MYGGSNPPRTSFGFFISFGPFASSTWRGTFFILDIDLIYKLRSKHRLITESSNDNSGIVKRRLRNYYHTITELSIKCNVKYSSHQGNIYLSIRDRKQPLKHSSNGPETKLLSMRRERCLQHVNSFHTFEHKLEDVVHLISLDLELLKCLFS